MTSNKYTILIAGFAALIIVVAGLGIVFNISVRNIESNQVQAKSNIVVTGPSPVISSVGGNPNPSIDSQTVQLSASVDFGTLIHGIAWYVNGTLIASYNSGPYGKNPVPTTLDHTFTSVGSFLVTVEASNAYGSSSKSFTQNVFVGPAPIITSINSTSSPAYAGQNVHFKASVNWEGYSGNLIYFVNGSKISGSSFTFNMSGYYKVSVVAISLDGNSSTASFTQVVNPINILSVNLMNNSTSISKTAPYNNSIDHEGSIMNTTLKESFMNYSIENNNGTSVTISNGTINGNKTLILNFTMIKSTGTVSIVYELALNETTMIYSGALSANFIPNSDPIHLGDIIELNYSSSLLGQLQGAQNGISKLAKTYLNSSNASLNTLGLYYSTIANSFNEFTSSLPSNITGLQVSSTQVQVFDGFWNCFFSILGLIGTILFLIFDGATIEDGGISAYAMFLDITVFFPAAFDAVLLDC